MEKEFNLSEKRKELFYVIENLEYAEFNDVDSRIDKIGHIKTLIKSQDKEFIKRLKEEIKSKIEKDMEEEVINDNDFYFPIIDKLAGDL